MTPVEIQIANWHGQMNIALWYGQMNVLEFLEDTFDTILELAEEDGDDD